MSINPFLKASNETVDGRVAEFGDAVKTRLSPLFKAAGIPYPPASLTFIGLKRERILQVYGAGAHGEYRFITEYRILAASGGPGPKMREGDRQVPEGLYGIDDLNPNSRFHLSLRVNYPNAFDRTKAKIEGRKNPGGEIRIHGNAVSIGCLAIGDEAAEDLFVLAAITGVNNIRVILAPLDFRMQVIPPLPAGGPSWVGELYETLNRELRKYPVKRPL